MLIGLSASGGSTLAQSSSGLGVSRTSPLASNYGTSASNRSRVPSQLGGGAYRSKPFSSYSPQPTVSPYMNLFRVDLGGSSDFNYSTLVRPQLQQQQVNEQLERQNLQNARRLQSIAAQADFNPEGSKDQYPTGHQTAFGYTGHYYPVAQPNVKRTANSSSNAGVIHARPTRLASRRRLLLKACRSSASQAFL